MEHKTSDRQQISPTELQQDAEARLKQNYPQLESMSADEARALIYQLQAEQIELERDNEELRKTQQDLINTRDSYAELFELAPVGCIVNDKLGTIHKANRTAAEMLGVERDKLLGTNISKYLSPRSLDKFYTSINKPLRVGTNQHFEIEAKRADNSLFDAQVERTSLETESNNRYRIALIDISKHKAAERQLEQLKDDLVEALHKTESKLHKSEDQLNLIKTAVANLNEGVVVSGDYLDWPDAAISYANPAMSEISGYSQEELIGQSLCLLQGEQTADETLQFIQSELKANRPVVVELKHYRKSGEAYDSELFVGPIFNPQGQRSHFISIHRDISQRKQTEKALRQNQARLEAILDTAVDAIITIDRQGFIESANAKAESLFGYNREELIGKNVSMLMPSPYREEHAGYISRYQRTGEPRIIGSCREQLARHKNGATIPIALSVREVSGLGLFAGFIRDLTEVKTLQKEVLDAASEEDRRIGQELHDNIQQQLVGVELLASALLESLKANASEQSGDASLLVDEIRQIGEQVHLLSRGLVPIEINPSDLQRALHRLASTTDKGNILHCRFDSRGDVLLGDSGTATHLYRITQEAVNNAIKHSGADWLNITLKSNQDTIQLYVEDNGVGITDPIHDLSGIGMRMMQYRAQLIGANLNIEPGQQGGTRVSCTIPLRTMVAANTEKEE